MVKTDYSKTIVLKKSDKKGKKYMVKIPRVNGMYKTVHFGAAGMSDYTKHKDPKRKLRYIIRHGGTANRTGVSSKEIWTKKGIDTAGFWSRWLLWGEPTLKASIEKIEKLFNVKISRR